MAEVERRRYSVLFEQLYLAEFACELKETYKIFYKNIICAEIIIKSIISINMLCGDKTLGVKATVTNSISTKEN